MYRQQIRSHSVYYFPFECISNEYGCLGIEREKLFSWEKSARETMDFYQEILQ